MPTWGRRCRGWRIERTVFLVIVPLVLFAAIWTLVPRVPTQVPIDTRRQILPRPQNDEPAAEAVAERVGPEAPRIPETPPRNPLPGGGGGGGGGAPGAPGAADGAPPRPASCIHNAGSAAAAGALGVAAGMTFSTLGAAYGMAKASGGVLHMVRLAPATALRGLIPVVMAELLAIYGFIAALNIVQHFDLGLYSSWAGYLDLASGLVVGLSGLAAGLAIGTVGEANVRSYAILLRRAQQAPQGKGPTRGRPGGSSPLSPLSPLSPEGPAASSNFEAAANTEELRAAAGRLFSAMLVTLIFAEGIGLYGLIVSMLLNGNAAAGMCPRTSGWEYPLGGRAAKGGWFAHCPATATAFLGAMGAALSVAGAIGGAAYGIAKSSTGVAHLGIRTPARLFRATTPVVMSELLAVYGFVNALIIALSIDPVGYSLFAGILDLAAGTAVGLGCLASGLAIGVVGDAGVRAYAKQERIFAALVLVLIFAEALGLFSLIVGLLLHNVGSRGPTGCPPWPSAAP